MMLRDKRLLLAIESVLVKLLRISMLRVIHLHVIRTRLAELLAVSFLHTCNQEYESSSNIPYDLYSTSTSTPIIVQFTLNQLQVAVEKTSAEESGDVEVEVDMSVQYTQCLNTICVVVPALSQVIRGCYLNQPLLAFQLLRVLFESCQSSYAYYIVLDEITLLSQSPHPVVPWLFARHPHMVCAQLMKVMLTSPFDLPVGLITAMKLTSLDDLFRPLMKHLQSHIIISKDIESMRILQEYRRSSNVLNEYIREYKENPLGNRGEILYSLLVSDSVQRYSEKDLISGRFIDILFEVCSNFIAIDTVQSLLESKLSSYLCERCLLPLLWDLGSSVTSRSETALKGLRVAVAVAVAVVPKSNLNPDEHVANMLDKRFLFIMLNLIQSPSPTTPSLAEMEQRYKALSAVIKYLKMEDIPKFIPKVMFVMDLALSHTYIKIRLAGLELAMTLFDRLSDSHIKPIAAAILVSLFPILEPSTQSHNLNDNKDSTDRNGGNSGNIAKEVGIKGEINGDTNGNGGMNGGNGDVNMTFATQDLSRLNLKILDTFEPTSSDGHMYDGISSTITLLSECIHSKSMSKILQMRGKDVAIELTKKLIKINFKEKYVILCNIPKIIELKSDLLAYDPMKNYIEQIDSIIALMKMKDSVRRLAIRHLIFLLKEQHRSIFKFNSLNNTNTNTITTTTTNNNNTTSTTGSHRDMKVIANILQSLLSLSSIETDTHVRTLCADALGLIGAIDPALISHQITIVSIESMVYIPPWQLSTFDFGMNVLEDHLVPALRTANGVGDLITQDRTTATTSSNSESNEDMPESLCTILKQKELYEIIRCFWSTRYIISVLPAVITLPIYTSELSYSRWISRWCRYLMDRIKGPFKEIFEPCHGIIRTRPTLSRFLLPYLIIDILIFNTTEAGLHDGIILEINTVLNSCQIYHNNTTNNTSATTATTTTNNNNQQQFKVSKTNSDGNQMCIQTVLSIVDQFQIWVNTISNNTASKNTLSLTSSDIAKTTNTINNTTANNSTSNTKNKNSITANTSAFTSTSSTSKLSAQIGGNNSNNSSNITIDYPGAAAAIKILLADISVSQLSKGAQSIGAYAKAIRYIEQGARDRHRMTRVELDGLVNAYSSLEDNDSLEGAMILRQLSDFELSPLDKAIEYQHLELWSSALLEYNTILYLREYQPFICKKRRRNSFSSRNNNNENSNDMLDSENSMFEEGSIIDDININSNNNVNVNVNNMDYITGFGVHRGQLRCLLELGHLDALIDQASGAMDRFPVLESKILPIAIEASYKLQNWFMLDDFVNRLDTLQLQQHNQHQLQPTNSNHMIEVEDFFQVYIGKLLLFTRKRDKTQFNLIITEAKSQVMSALSAASTESYGRAYPHLIQLHMLKEIDQIFTKLTEINPNSSQEVSSLVINNGYNISDNNCYNGYIQELDWNRRFLLLSPSLRDKSYILDIRRALLSLCGMNTTVSDMWLEQSALLRKSGRFDVSRIALRHANKWGLDREMYVLQ
eukprot:gene5258-10521_t